MSSAATNFEQEFAARFGDTAWLLTFGESNFSFAVDIDFQDEIEDGLVEMWAWPTDDKNFVYRLNPANVMKKSHQWEFTNLLDGTRWAVRDVRPDQWKAANRG